MPAKKKPVPKRMPSKNHFEMSADSKAKLQAAPKSAQTRNTLEGEKRSTIINTAKIKVPVIKPSCTDDKT